MGGERTAALTKSLRMRGTLIVWGAMSGFTTTMFIPDFIFRFVRVCLALASYAFSLSQADHSQLTFHPVH